MSPDPKELNAPAAALSACAVEEIAAVTVVLPVSVDAVIIAEHAAEALMVASNVVVVEVVVVAPSADAQAMVGCSADGTVQPSV